MGLRTRLRTWWQVKTGVDDTPLDCDAPAWLVSLAVHMLFLFVVAMITTYQPDEQITLTLTTPLDADEVETVIPDEFHFADLSSDDVGSGGLQGTDLAASIAPHITPESAAPTPEIPVMEVGPIRLQDPVLQATGESFGQNFVVKGTVGAVTSGAAGAIDRLTQEILLSLEERPTLVVWLFDQSGSLIRQRQTIHDRFDRVYNELDIIESHGSRAFRKQNSDDPLLSVVIGFGERVGWMTPRPTSDLNELKAAVSSISRDDSGIENVFQAISMAAEKYRKFRTISSGTREPVRNVMFIVFTDEVGNDQRLLDPTVDVCRRFEMPVYVVGVPAPFGRIQSLVKWVDPDPKYDQTPQWGTVDQGPETLYPERLRLGPSGRQEDRIDSGFGPFALTRLCYETGGIYFAVHPNRDTTRPVRRGETAAFSSHMRHFFDPHVMRRYRPDYVSQAEYQRNVAASKSRSALVQAARMTWLETLENPRVRFVARNEAALVNLLTEAQKNAAKLEPKIDSLCQTLQQGEKTREDELAPRWRAGYDLAYGHALAAKVRTETYNGMLAMTKRGMKFQNEKNNTWILKPTNKISTGSQLSSLGDKARTYLTRVVQEHPGTPWALLAQRELQTPLSWQWEESFTNLAPQQRNRGGNNNNPRPRRDEQPVKLAKPKPRRPVPKL